MVKAELVNAEKKW